MYFLIMIMMFLNENVFNEFFLINYQDLIIIILYNYLYLILNFILSFIIMLHSKNPLYSLFLI